MAITSAPEPQADIICSLAKGPVVTQTRTMLNKFRRAALTVYHHHKVVILRQAVAARLRLGSDAQVASRPGLTRWFHGSLLRKTAALIICR